MELKKRKKAQSGMEYLITYGWAVLVLGIVLLLLLSLRVLDVDWWSVQNEVWMLSSFSIPDFKATPHPTMPSKSILMFQLINNRGTNVTIYNITIKDTAGNDVPIGQGFGGVYVWDCPTSTCTLHTTSFPIINMTPGKRFIINGTIGLPGDLNTVFTTKIQVVYSTPRTSLGTTHNDTGMIRGRVEPE